MAKVTDFENSLGAERYQEAMRFLARAVEELSGAVKTYPPMHSAHEGYAVLLEELDELWEEVRVKQSKHDHKRMDAELVQIIAMALRFHLDICSKGKT